MPRTAPSALRALLLFLASVSLPPDVSALTANRTEGSARGEQTRAFTYRYDQVPLLYSFWFFFNNGDHHLKELGIRTEYGSSFADEIHLSYHDKNWDDPYQYYMSHIDLPARAGVVDGVGGECRGSCTEQLAAPPSPDHHFVLIDFGMYYHNGDHHIDEIGLLESGGSLTVYFNDKNDDDEFSWWASYMWVAPEFVSTTGSYSGINVKGKDSRPVPGFPFALSGFKFNYRKKDHHLEEIGIWTRPGWDLQIEYNDKNDDDRYDWEVNWAVLIEDPDDRPLGGTAATLDALVATLVEDGTIDQRELGDRIRRLEGDAVASPDAEKELPQFKNPARNYYSLEEQERKTHWWILLLAGVLAAGWLMLRRRGPG